MELLFQQKRLASRARKAISFLGICLGLAMAAGVANNVAAAAPPETNLVTRATELVDLMASGNFSNAVTGFDATMRAALPEAKLREAWQAVLKDAGPFKKQLCTRVAKQSGYDIVLVTCKFDRTTLDTRVVLDAKGQVAGLFFAPSRDESSLSTAPPYARTNSFREEEFIVGSGEWRLPGTLTRPLGLTNLLPALVLVHGSGPNDRDETVGVCKPFRDLAWGLASRGIVVLRYDKRTQVHAAKFTGDTLRSLTVKEETIDDALSAASQLRSSAGIDPKRIFVLGHSLGGTVAPRIGEADPKLGGLIIMAGATRPLEDLMVEQTRYLLSGGGAPSKDNQAKIEAMQVEVAKVKQLSDSDAAGSTLLLGAPPRYWLDLRVRDPVAVAQSLKQPVLILQGGRDYQVTETDFEGWKKALSSKPNVTLKLYPQLNHLFEAGEGKSTPAEYERAGFVSESAVADIAQWIQGH
jgi:uncharacterized protein